MLFLTHFRATQNNITAHYKVLAVCGQKSSETLAHISITSGARRINAKFTMKNRNQTDIENIIEALNELIAQIEHAHEFIFCAQIPAQKCLPNKAA